MFRRCAYTTCLCGWQGPHGCQHALADHYWHGGFSDPAPSPMRPFISLINDYTRIKAQERRESNVGGLAAAEQQQKQELVDNWTDLCKKMPSLY